MAADAHGETVAQLLFRRLFEEGAGKAFVVAGDYAFPLLDAAPARMLVPCANELGAGYAADGFARVAGLGCVVLTFSVGELSAANAVAGAFAERVPLVVVVGVPAEARFTSSAWPHHTVGIDGKLDAPLRMLSQITAAQGDLTAETAEAEIERLLHVCLSASLPVYVRVAEDEATKVAVKVTPQPLALPAPPRRALDCDAAALAEAVRRTVECLLAASRPLVVADVGVLRAHAEAPLAALVEALNDAPVVSMCAGRGALSERHGAYCGVYQGGASNPRGVCALVAEADVLLRVGVLVSDFAAGACPTSPSPAEPLLSASAMAIDSRIASCTVGDVRFERVPMRAFLPALTEALLAARARCVGIGDRRDVELAAAYAAPRRTWAAAADAAAEWRSTARLLDQSAAAAAEAAFVASRTCGGAAQEASTRELGGDGDADAAARAGAAARTARGALCADYVLAQAVRHLGGGDLLVTDTGTAMLGVTAFPLPSDASIMLQALYGSIGWGLPAALGAAVALQDKGARAGVTLVIGDGALQMTAAELGTFSRVAHAPVTVVVIANEGYLIERLLGASLTASYNDIPTWRYSELLRVMGATGLGAVAARCTSPRELDAALATAAAPFLGTGAGACCNAPGRLTLLEAVTERLDVPSAALWLAEKTRSLYSDTDDAPAAADAV